LAFLLYHNSLSCFIWYWIFIYWSRYY